MPSRKPSPSTDPGPPPPPPDTRPDTRTRLVGAMARALQRRGLHGVGLTELLAEAGAPKGVLYHHFPGGKTELAVAAIDAVAARLGASLAALASRPDMLLPQLQRWLEGAEQALQDSGFEQGCPLATVALESAAEDVTLREALARAFAGLRTQLAGALAAAGIEAARAPALAALIVASYEGALLQARVAGQPQPMREATGALLALLAAELRAGPGGRR